MYRIELAPGEETVFRTLEELAVGVHNGVVTSRARIYHSASQKWLPIEFHPHYKQALEHPAARVQTRSGRGPERTERPTFAAPRPVAPLAPVAAPAVPAVAAPSLAAPGVRSSWASAPIAAVPIARAPRAAAPMAREAHETAKFRAGHDVIAHTEPMARIAHQAIAVAPPPRSLPPVMASPVLHLPPISYPEITPLQEPVHAPAAGAAGMTGATGSGGPARSQRSLHLAGAFTALALGAYALMSFAPSRSDAAPVEAVTEHAPLPAPVVMTQPASSGFAPALEPRAIVTGSSAVPGPAAAPPTPSPARDSSIAPAPVQLELAIPVLPGLDSLPSSGRQQSDSVMRRILRAVSGGKDLPRRP